MADKEGDIFDANVREVMKTKAGKDVIWRILEECGVYHNTFTGNSQTYFLEGKREVGLFILSILDDADPTLYARTLLDKQKLKD